jgi:hypothetical protein
MRELTAREPSDREPATSGPAREETGPGLTAAGEGADASTGGGRNVSTLIDTRDLKVYFMCSMLPPWGGEL